MALSSDFGKASEEKASSFLESRGFEILARNFRIRGGEIDIVAKKGVRIHFVEVKARKTSLYGSGREAVNSKKMAALIKSAYFFLRINKFESYQFQIDVIEIENGAIFYLPNVTL